jgi:hypothetical protein
MRLLKNRVGLSSLIATIFFLIVFVSAITVFAFVIAKQSQLNQAETSAKVILTNKSHEIINAAVNGADAVFTNRGSKPIQISYVSTRVGDAVSIARVDVPLPPGSSYATTLVGETGIITGLGNYFSAGTP